MKNSFRIIGVTILTTIYCFAVGVVATSPLVSDYESHQTSEQKQYFATLSSSLLCHTSQSETSVSSFNNLPVPDFKNLFDKLWATARSIEQLFKSALNQYLDISIDFLIQHRKTDLIFPFQYFW